MRSANSKFMHAAFLAATIAIAATFTVARADHGSNNSGNASIGSHGGGNGGDDNGGGGNVGGNRGGGGGGNNGGGGGIVAGGGNGGGGNGGGEGRGLGSLKTVPIPVTDFSPYLNAGADARAAAITLGKALFWDTQTGGDGQQACASCHFNAGADSRTKGQINPGAAGAWQVLGGGAAANYAPSASEYPLHMLANMANRNSQLMYDSANITGSQGLHHTRFVDVFPGSAVDVGTVITQDQAPDPYGVADVNNASLKVNTRRTTGKNAPSVINAVYNFRNFWDGRAQNIFNGVNPSGANDPTAFVLAADANTAQLITSGGQPAHQTVAIVNGALASQSVGPPNNATEMSYDGRDFKKLGKKMLSLKPLGNQLVAVDDSVLGAYSNQLLAPGIPGISTTYDALIQQAFQPKWWNSSQLVDASGNFVTDASGAPKSAPAANTSEFTLEEFNFSLFWGIAIQMYESTLVANDSRFDRYMDGDRTALTSLELQGMNIFTGKGHCTECHMGPEFTDASVGNQAFARSGGAGNPFPGFHMIGVRPASDDKIIAGGAAKTPSLRDVDLTPPYFHNGGQLTLEQVVMFYARGGDFGTRGVDQDSEIEPRSFNASDVEALVAFLKSLTDARVANQSAPFDHPSIDLPNGAVGNSFAVTQDGTGNALDDPDSMLHVQATGALGGAPLATFTESLHGTPLDPISIIASAGTGGGNGGGGSSGGGNGGGADNGGNLGGSGANNTGAVNSAATIPPPSGGVPANVTVPGPTPLPIIIPALTPGEVATITGGPSAPTGDPAAASVTSATQAPADATASTVTPAIIFAVPTAATNTASDTAASTTTSDASTNANNSATNSTGQADSSASSDTSSNDADSDGSESQSGAAPKSSSGADGAAHPTATSSSTTTSTPASARRAPKPAASTATTATAPAANAGASTK